MYVNECSASSQMADVAASEDAVMKLLDSLAVIGSCDTGAVTVEKYYSSNLYTSMLSPGVTVDSLPNKDLKRKLKLSLRGAKCWEKAPITALGATYLYKGKDVTLTSMSEAYEQSTGPMLFNFILGGIEEPEAAVEKKGIGIVNVASYSDANGLLAWLITKGWRKKQYDLTSNIAPHDDESILSDSNRFEATDYHYKGRLMYRRKGTDHLCYIDSKHFGEAAHIEEFNETTKKMIRTLKINEDIEHHALTKNEKGRTLKIEKY